jgi:hypothetical protein
MTWKTGATTSFHKRKHKRKQASADPRIKSRIKSGDNRQDGDNESATNAANLPPEGHTPS